VRLFAVAAVRRVADPAVVFMNVNTPEELARARDLVMKRPSG
jgi:CTP:molybdopterin cytidylyltransferase MocA